MTCLIGMSCRDQIISPSHNGLDVSIFIKTLILISFWYIFTRSGEQKFHQVVPSTTQMWQGNTWHKLMKSAIMEFKIMTGIPISPLCLYWWCSRLSCPLHSQSYNTIWRRDLGIPVLCTKGLGVLNKWHQNILGGFLIKYSVFWLILEKLCCL